MKGTIQSGPIDISQITVSGSHDVGSLVTFQGIVRGTENSKELFHLFYEADEHLAEDELKKIIEEASQKFRIVDCSAVHRVGIVKPGEISLLVAVQSAHRNEGFEACRYIVEQIKQRLPIWKKDHFKDSTERWH